MWGNGRAVYRVLEKYFAFMFLFLVLEKFFLIFIIIYISIVDVENCGSFKSFCYIYIYIYRLSKCTTRVNEAQSSDLLSKPYPSTINNKMKD